MHKVTFGIQATSLGSGAAPGYRCSHCDAWQHGMFFPVHCTYLDITSTSLTLLGYVDSLSLCSSVVKPSCGGPSTSPEQQNANFLCDNMRTCTENSKPRLVTLPAVVPSKDKHILPYSRGHLSIPPLAKQNQAMNEICRHHQKPKQHEH